MIKTIIDPENLQKAILLLLSGAKYDDAHIEKLLDSTNDKLQYLDLIFEYYAICLGE